MPRKAVLIKPIDDTLNNVVKCIVNHPKTVKKSQLNSKKLKKKNP